MNIMLDPQAVAVAIKAAPAFARLGLSVRDERLRERAVDALANAIVEGLEGKPDDRDQIPLPF